MVLCMIHELHIFNLCVSGASMPGARPASGGAGHVYQLRDHGPSRSTGCQGRTLHQ